MRFRVHFERHREDRIFPFVRVTARFRFGQVRDVLNEVEEQFLKTVLLHGLSKPVGVPILRVRFLFGEGQRAGFRHSAVFVLLTLDREFDRVQMLTLEPGFRMVRASTSPFLRIDHVPLVSASCGWYDPNAELFGQFGGCCDDDAALFTSFHFGILFANAAVSRRIVCLDCILARTA